MDPGETYYSEAAREMLESGEYIVPHLNYQVYFSKPILNFWLIAGSYNLFGVSEFAARIPFGLLSCLLIFATYAVTCRIADKKAALLAGLFTASAPLMVLISKASSIDLAFSVFLNLAAYGFVWSVFCRRYWPLVWLALALAVLTKGPAGLVLFGIGTGLFLLLEKPGLKRLWYWFKCTKPWLGMPLFMLVALPWYGLVYKATKGLFLQVFFIYENLARFQGKTNIHKGNLFYYFAVVAYGLAPWFLFAPQTLRQLFWLPLTKRWCEGKKLVFKSTYRPYENLMSKTDSPARANQKDSDLQETFAGEHLDQGLVSERSTFYLACWVLGVFSFFSLSKTQLDTYILPILAPSAILLAVAMVQTIKAGADPEASPAMQWDRRWFSILSFIVLALTLAATLASGYVAATWTAFRPNQNLFLALAALAGLTGTIAQLRALIGKHAYAATLAQALTICALTAALFPVGFQYFSHERQENMRKLAEHLPSCRDEIALYGAFKPSLIHYLRRPIDTISTVDQFTLARGPIPDDGLSYGPTPSGRKQIVIGDDKHMKDFQTRPELKLKELFREGDWAAYELTNGYVERPKSLEESFKWMMAAGQSFTASNDFGPLTVPLGGGDADWYKARQKERLYKQHKQ